MTKVIIVTGGSRGIGKAIIQDILNRPTEGNTLVISVARHEGPLKQLQDMYGEERFQYVVGDVVDELVQDNILQIALKYNNHIHSIVSNAGILEPVDNIVNFRSKEWKEHFDINFFSVVSLVTKCLPYMEGDAGSHGNVIMVSSGASVKAYKGWSCYCASKAALNSFTLSVATEMNGKVRSIAVAPGVVDTQMQVDIREKLGPEGMPSDALKRFTDLHNNNQLLDASVPGHVYAELAIKGIPQDLNGLYLRYDDEKLSQ